MPKTPPSSVLPPPSLQKPLAPPRLGASKDTALEQLGLTVNSLVVDYLAADFSMATTALAVTGLSFDIKANEKWLAIFTIFTRGLTTDGLTVDFSVPTGCTGWYSVAGVGDSDDVFSNFVATITNDLSFTAAEFDAATIVTITAVFVNSTTAGTCELRAAKQADAGADTALSEGSNMLAVKQT